MMFFCVAPLAVTWALVFRDPLGDQTGMQPISYQCFSERAYCESAATAANAAFLTDASRHRAACEEQPAGPAQETYRSIPFGTRAPDAR